MIILQILPELNVGGVETGTVDLARSLLKKGHTPIIVSNGGQLVNLLEIDSILHIKLPVHKKSPIIIFKMVRRVAEIIEDYKVDIVHCRSRVPAVIGFFAVRRAMSKSGRLCSFVTTCHGYYAKHLFSYFMGWGKFVIVNSQVIANHMRNSFGVPYQRLRLIARGVDLDGFKLCQANRKDKKGFVIGMIGRISPIKGHTYFIRAMTKIVRSFPDVKALIVGEAPASKSKYKDQLVDMVRRYNLGKNVEFLGARSDVPKLLCGMDAIVLATTTQEAFGRVIIEAQACGVPVVATKVGGVVDIITDRKNGVLVPPEDAGAIASALTEVLKDRDFSKMLAENGRKIVEEQFSLEKMVERTVKVYKEALNPRIAVIKLSAIGDCILAIPSLRCLKHKFPNAFISVVVGDGAKAVFQRCPYIDELIIYRKRFNKIGSFIEMSRSLRRLSIDIAIDLQNNKDSHIMSFVCAAPLRYGYHNKKFSFLLNFKIAGAKDKIPPVEHQFRLLKMLGVANDNLGLELWESDEDKNYIDEFLKSHWLLEGQKLVGMNLGASPRWFTKRWPVERFAKAADELAKRNIRVILTGTKQDGQLNRKFISLTKSKPIDATGRTNFSQLVSLIKKCDCFITSDSSPMHIAAACAVPFVALFGPTDPTRHMPPAKNFIMIKKDIDCHPCYKPGCKNHDCMRLISVDEVLAAANKLLEKT